MRAYLDCYPCFFTQALKTSRMILTDEKEIWEILSAVSSYLSGVAFGVTPPEIGRGIYRIIAEYTGVEDPYYELKNKCTKQALSLYPEFKKIVANSDDSLLTAAKLAIAGNIIDFGIAGKFDLEKDVREILAGGLTIDDYKEFSHALESAEKIIYLGDNAGETVFDRILIEEMRKPVTYVVREKPIINDAVREDAEAAGIDKVAEIISSGCDGPGTIPGMCDAKFLDILRTADLIISKGQGNYEGLSDENLPVFFLLKAKCHVIARDIGVAEGSIILKRKSKLSD